jgi:hypothetical protein
MIQLLSSLPTVLSQTPLAETKGSLKAIRVAQLNTRRESAFGVQLAPQKPVLPTIEEIPARALSTEPVLELFGHFVSFRLTFCGH